MKQLRNTEEIPQSYRGNTKEIHGEKEEILWKYKWNIDNCSGKPIKTGKIQGKSVENTVKYSEHVG